MLKAGAAQVPGMVTAMPISSAAPPILITGVEYDASTDILEIDVDSSGTKFDVSLSIADFDWSKLKLGLNTAAPSNISQADIVAFQLTRHQET